MTYTSSGGATVLMCSAGTMVGAGSGYGIYSRLRLVRNGVTIAQGYLGNGTDGITGVLNCQDTPPAGVVTYQLYIDLWKINQNAIGLSLGGGSSGVGNAGFGDYSAAGMAAAFAPVPHAVGGVFGGGHGIYSQPTLFKDGSGKTGVMAEAGPEGILPLKRGKDGKLGVVASGGGGSQINNFTPTIVINGNADDETIAKMQASLRAEFKQHVAQSISKNNVKSQRPGGMNYR
jgi:hypothetical protein